jgi:hypothetical protein
MQVNLRSEQRFRCSNHFSISWQTEDGITHSAEAAGVNHSPSGLALQCPVKLIPGLAAYIEARDGQITGHCAVRHCTPSGAGYLIGIQLGVSTRQNVDLPAQDLKDYYEFLQISPKAEPDTIQRVYRFLAARFHPDNPETGDPQKFVQLAEAFSVLSDPQRRAEYDAILGARNGHEAAFQSVDFMDGIEGELNRRLAVLSVLYRRCRADVENPNVSLAEMETIMGFPREYLDFTTWYLRNKKYITREDNSDFALTIHGVDFVEANYSHLPMLRNLLNACPSVRGENQPQSADDHVLSNLKVLMLTAPELE